MAIDGSAERGARFLASLQQWMSERTADTRPDRFAGCSPERLLGYADRGIPHEDISGFARHIERCWTCASRWELLQTDPHLHLAQIVALRWRADEQHADQRFALGRSQAHGRRCAACGKLMSLVDRLLSIGALVAGSSDAQEFGLQLRQVSSRVVRSHAAAGDLPKLQAAVLDSDEMPRFDGAELACAVLELKHATLSPDGLLSILVAVPERTERIWVALSLEERSLLVPSVTPSRGEAHLRFDTGARSAMAREDARDVEASRLSFWVAMSDAERPPAR